MRRSPHKIQLVSRCSVRLLSRARRSPSRRPRPLRLDRVRRPTSAEPRPLRPCRRGRARRSNVGTERVRSRSRAIRTRRARPGTRSPSWVPTRVRSRPQRPVRDLLLLLPLPVVCTTCTASRARRRTRRRRAARRGFATDSGGRVLVRRAGGGARLRTTRARGFRSRGGYRGDGGGTAPGARGTSAESRARGRGSVPGEGSRVRIAGFGLSQLPILFGPSSLPIEDVPRVDSGRKRRRETSRERRRTTGTRRGGASRRQRSASAPVRHGRAGGAPWAVGTSTTVRGG